MQRDSRAPRRWNRSSKPPPLELARVIAFVSVPVDTFTLPPSSLRPLFAVLLTTGSEPRAPPRSLQSSRRRRLRPCGVPLPQSIPFVSAPVDTPPSLGSLGDNQLCGLDEDGDGTYTAEGINKLIEALKGSAVTSLKCVRRRPIVFAILSAPTDMHLPFLLYVPPTHPLQYPEQPHRSRGRLHARCHPQRE